jgi:hypothetical protein
VILKVTETLEKKVEDKKNNNNKKKPKKLVSALLGKKYVSNENAKTQKQISKFLPKNKRMLTCAERPGRLKDRRIPHFRNHTQTLYPTLSR